jgi:hypothetical protein
MKKIISIVPRLPPAIDGVGDYACLLSQYLVNRHDISTKFIACDPLQSADFAPKSVDSIQLPQRSSDSLVTALDLDPDIDILLLHYVGYGYAKRGCPLWLIPALTKWKRSKSSRRLVTMFHEVYATAQIPWNSQFWTSPIQKKIAKDLIDLSDRVITSNQRFVDRINSLSRKHQDRILISPIFSTIGECSVPLPLSARQPWLVTFGNAGLRKSIYTKSLEQLTTVCQQLGITEIYDIGHNSSEIVRSVSQVKVNAMGVLPVPEISQILSMAQVGFLNYPIPYIGKSTIFAAYASHKLFPVFDRHNLGDNLDGVNFNRHYWSILKPGDKIDLNLAQKIANDAYQWYCQHSLSLTADRVANVLNEI